MEYEINKKSYIDVELYKNYIPRKDRIRRGKREKEGRITESGKYHSYDEESIEYFNIYKQSMRQLRLGINKSLNFSQSSLTSIYSKVMDVTSTFIGETIYPIKSDIIPDISNGSISFSGGGYNCAYHLGVVKYIFEHPNIFTNTIYLGASGGSGIAVIVLAYQNDFNRMSVLNSIIQDIINLENENYTLSEQVDKYTNILLGYIDQNRFEKYILNSDKLRISLTNLSDRDYVYVPTNEIISKIDTLDHLAKAIRASACIPGFLDDHVRTIDNKSYLDGGLTNNLPVIDEQTIRVSCINYPTLKAEVHPNKYLDIMKCFTHPGKDHIIKMSEDGYLEFLKFMQDYINKIENDIIDAEIRNIENEFINS
jgi:hypothetical protein